jgi:hypothetical protein
MKSEGTKGGGGEHAGKGPGGTSGEFVKASHR